MENMLRLQLQVDGEELSVIYALKGAPLYHGHRLITKYFSYNYDVIDYAVSSSICHQRHLDVLQKQSKAEQYKKRRAPQTTVSICAIVLQKSQL